MMVRHPTPPEFATLDVDRVCRPGGSAGESTRPRNICVDQAVATRAAVSRHRGRTGDADFANRPRTRRGAHGPENLAERTARLPHFVNLLPPVGRQPRLIDLHPATSPGGSSRVVLIYRVEFLLSAFASTPQDVSFHHRMGHGAFTPGRPPVSSGSIRPELHTVTRRSRAWAARVPEGGLGCPAAQVADALRSKPGRAEQLELLLEITEP
jgi:hypothetical protein